jgi:kinesin family protein 18/19
MFTASQARRMVKSEKDHDLKSTVLGPRALSVTKNSAQRRVTLGGDFRNRDISLTGRDAMRLSAMAAPGAENRASLGAPIKGAFR